MIEHDGQQTGLSNHPATIQDVELTFKRHYDTQLWDACRAALATVGSLSLLERVHCLVLIFEGPPSSGKSIVVGSLDPPDQRSEQFLYRSDDFTPASFVSHAADKTEKELANIDLLPRIIHKTLITKELSPLFQSDEHRLRDNFARLTSILDGKGHSSDSGSHGRRSVTGNFTFNWIGATTKIPDRTHDLMGRMGSRLLIYEFPDKDVQEDEVVDFICSYEPQKAEEECHIVVSGFILNHFQLHPVSSIQEGCIVIPREPFGRQIARYAMLVAHGRKLDLKEGPWRVSLLLRMLAQGSALINGRYQVDETDLQIIEHVAISTLPTKRRAILRSIQVRALAHKSDTPNFCSSFSHMQLEDMVSTGLVVWKGNAVVIAPKWRWLIV